MTGTSAAAKLNRSTFAENHFFANPLRLRQARGGAMPASQEIVTCKDTDYVVLRDLGRRRCLQGQEDRWSAGASEEDQRVLTDVGATQAREPPLLCRTQPMLRSEIRQRERELKEQEQRRMTKMYLELVRRTPLERHGIGWVRMAIDERRMIRLRHYDGTFEVTS